MFKILHLPGATYFIAGGLSTEALLFFLLGFQREEKPIDWRRAYPELDEDFDGELPKATKKAVGGGDSFSNTAALDQMLAEAKIGPELIGSLANGLRTFGDKATASYDTLSNAFEKASANLSEMANSNIDSKSYHEQVNKMAKNLSSLNAVYELELQDSSNHLKSMNKFYQDMAVTLKNFNDSATDSKQFKDEVGKLAKNLSTLNSIYGNMLSAMNQPRKETPRQRMMGILYLVLLGLVALSVPDSLMDAFKNIKNSLDASTSNVDKGIQTTYSTFEATKLKEQHDRAKPIYDRARKATALSNDLNGYVEQLKQELIKEGDGINPTTGDVGARENLDISPRVMINQKKGEELRKKINETKDGLMALLKDKEKQGVNFSLNAEAPKQTSGPSKTWEEAYFGDGIPLGATLTTLAKIQTDTKNAENEVVKKILGEAEQAQVNLDKFEAAAVASTGYVLVGQPYTADVFLTAYDSKLSPNITVNGSPLQVDADNDGNIQKYTTPEQTYMVARPSAVVSPDKMNVLYIGVPNPITVSAPGIAAKDLKAVFAGKSGGSTSAANLRAQDRIFAKLENFDFDAKFNITRFTLLIAKPRQDVVSYTATGNEFTGAMKAAMNSVTPGTTIVFKDIIAVGPDGAQRGLDSIVLTHIPKNVKRKQPKNLRQQRKLHLRLTPMCQAQNPVQIQQKNAKVTPYPNLRESDVAFAKRVWREIDLREKMNQYLISPKQRLIDVILDAVAAGELTAYDPISTKEDPNGDSFTARLTPAAARAKLADSSVVDKFDKDGNKIGSTLKAGEFNPDSLVKFRIKEDWVFDRQRSIFEPRIVGIAPMIKVKVGSTEDYQPAFWIYFPEARPIFATKEVVSRNSDATGLSFDDIFMKRIFTSYIVKESNDKDERIKDYAQGIDKLYESERIKKSLMDWELTLWQY
eukprot:gene16039-16208_t